MVLSNYHEIKLQIKYKAVIQLIHTYYYEYTALNIESKLLNYDIYDCWNHDHCHA